MAEYQARRFGESVIESSMEAWDGKLVSNEDISMVLVMAYVGLSVGDMDGNVGADMIGQIDGCAVVVGPISDLFIYFCYI